jgi:Protein of unknown function (DUF3551)
VTIIRAVFSVLIALAALAAISSRPSAAEVYRPWCVDYPPDGTSCVFTSYEQCMLTARGAGGYCVQNPWYLQYGSGQKGPETTGQGERPRRR